MEISVKPPAAPVDPTVCQQLFAELLGKRTIQFETGQRDAGAGFHRPAGSITETALRCPTATIEIVGHTDSDGDVLQPDTV